MTDNQSKYVNYKNAVDPFYYMFCWSLALIANINEH